MDGNTRDITLTGKQLLGVVALSGLQIKDGSPLSELAQGDGVTGLGSDDLSVLQGTGWLAPGTSTGLTPAARNILQALCQPSVHVRLLLGTRDLLGAVDTYSALGLYADGLVSFSANTERDEYHLQPGLSPLYLAEALTAQALNGPLDDKVSFHASPDLVEFVTLLAIFDAHLHTQLKAMLDRQQDPKTQFSVQLLREMLVEGRNARDLGWAVTFFTHLFAFLDYDLDEDKIAAGLVGLQAKGLVSAIENSGYAPTKQLLELCRMLLPAISYGALHLEQRGNAGNVHATFLAFLRGPLTVLIAQPVVDEGGQRVVALDCVNATKLADILFDLGLPDLGLMLATEKTDASKERAVCPSCGAERIPDRKFCTKCGAAFESAEEQREKAAIPAIAQATCPVCKVIVKPGRKFCSACGAPLTVPTEKAEVR